MFWNYFIPIACFVVFIGGVVGALLWYHFHPDPRPGYIIDPNCCCGGEDSDGRSDVLRCPIHGIG